MGIESAITALAGSTIASLWQGHKAASAQQDATDNATKAAKATADAATEATNKANQKAPDSAALLAANQQAGKGGAGGTLLTGSTGIDPSLLQLGKTTLLGG